MNATKIKPGDTVGWTDPDGGEFKTIKVAGVSIRGDAVVLTDRDGGVTEALACELSPPKRPHQIADEHREALRLLRDIVAAQEAYFDRNDNGSHDEFQRAADAFHDAVDNAEAWLEVIDEA